jgi:hypothetical protein
MKWTKVKSETVNEAYELWDDKVKSLTLSITSPMTSPGFAKIQCNDTRRTFMIEKKGIFRSRIILRNEYGTRLGQVIFEGNRIDDGFIEMDGQRLRYTIHEQPTPEMVIYNSSNDLLLICDLAGLTGAANNFPKSSNQNIYPALLLALSWHQFTKVSKEPELEFVV